MSYYAAHMRWRHKMAEINLLHSQIEIDVLTYRTGMRKMKDKTFQELLDAMRAYMRRGQAEHSYYHRRGSWRYRLACWLVGTGEGGTLMHERVMKDVFSPPYRDELAAMMWWAVIEGSRKDDSLIRVLVRDDTVERWEEATGPLGLARVKRTYKLSLDKVEVPL